MKKLRVYLDTSVISHLDAPDAPEKMTDTRKLWASMNRYEAAVSDVTIDEIGRCSEPKLSYLYAMIQLVNPTRLPRVAEAEQLCMHYVNAGGLPPKSYLDALHIAIATVFGCSVILSWNFKHIVNLRAMTAVGSVNAKEGYEPIHILTPTMLLEGDD